SNATCTPTRSDTRANPQQQASTCSSVTRDRKRPPMYEPSDEQIEALAKTWIDDWDTRADEHEDWINDFRDLITSDAGQAIIRAAQAEALREASVAVRAALSSDVGGHTSTYSVRTWLSQEADRIEAAD